MFDWIASDPETMWLNVTNLVLGVCVVVCLMVGISAVGRDILAKARERARNREVFVYDAHTMMHPELGLTMADGGEPLPTEDKKPKKG